MHGMFTYATWFEGIISRLLIYITATLIFFGYRVKVGDPEVNPVVGIF